ncbi:hypothetical protein HanPSC8_Chr11g0479921 [Helianthus annuus]|nr:hypothetical protein HanPSC8_Chr11g0479921 [Helianthus annuus]
MLGSLDCMKWPWEFVLPNGKALTLVDFTGCQPSCLKRLRPKIFGYGMRSSDPKELSL